MSEQDLPAIIDPDGFVLETNPSGSWIYNIRRTELKRNPDGQIMKDYVIGAPLASKSRTVAELTAQGYVGLFTKN